MINFWFNNKYKSCKKYPYKVYISILCKICKNYHKHSIILYIQTKWQFMKTCRTVLLQLPGDNSFNLLRAVSESTRTNV